MPKSSNLGVVGRQGCNLISKIVQSIRVVPPCRCDNVTLCVGYPVMTLRETYFRTGVRYGSNRY